MRGGRSASRPRRRRRPPAPRRPRGRSPPARRPDARRRRRANRRAQRHDDPVEEQDGIGTDARRECVHDELRPKHTAAIQHRRWRPRRPCGDTVPYTARPRNSSRRRRSPDAPEVLCVESYPDFPAGIEPRILLTLARERVEQSPYAVEGGTVDPVARRPGSVRLELDGEGFTPTVSSWSHGSIATSPRARHRTRTARSRRSSRTGTVELASTESGRRDASRALTTGRRRTDRPWIWSKSRSSAFCGDWVASERYTTSSTNGRFPSASRRSVATNACDGPDTAASGRSSSSNRSDRHDGARPPEASERISRLRLTNAADELLFYSSSTRFIFNNSFSAVASQLLT